LLPRQSAIDFQNGKFFFPFSEKRGRAKFEKNGGKIFGLNSDEIGGGSKKRKRSRKRKVALAPIPPVRGQHIAPRWSISQYLNFRYLQIAYILLVYG